MLSENLEIDIEFVLNHSAPARFADLTPVAKNSKEIRLVDETRQHTGYFKYREPYSELANIRKALLLAVPETSQ